MADSFVTLKSYNAGVPNIYQTVEWIKNNGQAWIDLGVPCSSDLVIQIKLMTIAIAGGIIIGGYTSEDDDFRLFGAHDQWYLDFGNANSSNGRLGPVGAISVNTTYNIEFGNCYIYDLTSKDYIGSKTAQSSFTKSYNVKIGPHPTAAGDINEYFSIIIFKNNIKIRECVPVYRKSDSVVGLYDLCTKAFLEAESGSFIAGPNK